MHFIEFFGLLCATTWASYGSWVLMKKGYDKCHSSYKEYKEYKYHKDLYKNYEVPKAIKVYKVVRKIRRR